MLPFSFKTRQTQQDPALVPTPAGILCESLSLMEQTAFHILLLYFVSTEMKAPCHDTETRPLNIHSYSLQHDLTRKSIQPCCCSTPRNGTLPPCGEGGKSLLNIQATQI